MPWLGVYDSLKVVPPQLIRIHHISDYHNIYYDYFNLALVADSMDVSQILYRRSRYCIVHMKS